MTMIRHTFAWKVPKIALNILRHPFEQNPLAIFFNEPVHYLSTVDGEIQSYCVLIHHRSYAQLKDVFTFPAHRGQGLATRLIEKVVEHVKTPIYLCCPSTRVSFYERLGFRRTLQASIRLKILAALSSFFSQIVKGRRVVIMKREITQINGRA